ncbi:T9SS type A sorting domain-containing protein [Lewinella sp. W8]|uniref:T9SS type A sorting domain-containing protein n=1 Tax=Lewinella sp. W8 TaxID=2528208 RepID=UPI00106769D7|nr:T9SS type A sorting domain-containing protein [Lewinella sp. W8]MTB50545.1 T9SS type A sorting domain-containing protein [Lewinella sp. W8]
MALLRTCVLLFIALGYGQLYAQIAGDGHGITCGMRDTVDAYQAAPLAFLNGTSELGTKFTLRFSDSVPSVAEASMTFAANIWGSILQSEIPIVVDVDWQDRMDNRLLASAGPSTLIRGFVGSEPDTWYPVALAEAISGQQLNGTDDADITVVANSTANWYFGTDGDTPRNRIDLVSVFLHELGHGLGFLSSADTISETELGLGFGGRFIIYDLFLETEGGLPLADPSVFTTPSPELLQAATMNDLVFNGPEANRENGGRVPLFAPAAFDIGSSVSHLDEQTYRPGSENALMTPFFSAGEAVHTPGPVTLGIFADMGWPLNFDLVSTQDVATQPLTFYPNPASSAVTIKLPAGNPVAEIQLFDLQGRQLSAQVTSPNQSVLTVETRHLRPGTYLLRYLGKEDIRTGRLVIK